MMKIKSGFWVLCDEGKFSENQRFWMSNYTVEGEIYSSFTEFVSEAKQFTRKPKERYTNTGGFKPMWISNIKGTKR